MAEQETSKKRPMIFLAPGEGRTYPLGPKAEVHAVFKADREETAHQYSFSEWTFQPHARGSGVHTHRDDDVFYVIEGTMSIFVEDKWITAPAGSFVLVPGGVPHNFENRTDKVARVINFSAPGTFEENMPELTKHFLHRSDGRVWGK